MIKTRISTKRGFTLIETMIAVAVLSMTMGGVLTIVTVSVRNLGIQKDRLIATKIASEGIEFMINKRDNNTRCLQSGTCTLDCSDWRTRLLDTPGDSCNFEDRCWEIDAAIPDGLLPNNAFSNLTVGNCNTLSTSNYLCVENTGIQTGKFTYCGNDPAKMLPQQYTRIVKLYEYPFVDDKIRVESIVRWESRIIGSQEIRLEEVIFGS